MIPLHQKSLRVLVIEDNKDLAGNITDYLVQKGHEVDYSVDGVTGLNLALTLPLDVIVLDIMLPRIDGLTLCKRYRQEAEQQAPIIMLTARDTLDDKITGFEAGADDYLVKPFSLRELEARIHALTTRYAHPATLLQVGSLQVDTGSRTVRKGDRQITLNRTCFLVLVILLRAYPNVVRREEMEHELWGNFPPGSDSLRSHIYTLRKELDEGKENSLIQTIRGVGYKLNNDHNRQLPPTL